MLGVTVRSEDGVGAIESVVAEFDPHVVLLDVHLGGVDGFEVLEALRRRGRAARSIRPHGDRRHRAGGRAKGARARSPGRAVQAVRPHRVDRERRHAAGRRWPRRNAPRSSSRAAIACRASCTAGPKSCRRSTSSCAPPTTPRSEFLAREPRGPHPAELHPRVRRAPRPRRTERGAAPVGRHDPRRGPSAASAPRRRSRHLAHRERHAVALARCRPARRPGRRHPRPDPSVRRLQPGRPLRPTHAGAAPIRPRRTTSGCDRCWSTCCRTR